MRIVPARSERDIEDVRALFREYEASLAVDLSVQGIAAEIAALPGRYAPPTGALFLARDPNGQALGCVGVRPFDRTGACEVKRLYVRPAGRGSGAGRALVEEAIAFARAAGYRDILLDSLPDMTAAVGLYRALGFAEVPPYWNSTLPGTLYFGKRLRPE
jgi:putative acetyltransferase